MTTSHAVRMWKISSMYHCTMCSQSADCLLSRSGLYFFHSPHCCAQSDWTRSSVDSFRVRFSRICLTKSHSDVLRQRIGLLVTNRSTCMACSAGRLVGYSFLMALLVRFVSCQPFVVRLSFFQAEHSCLTTTQSVRIWKVCSLC